MERNGPNRQRAALLAGLALAVLVLLAVGTSMMLRDRGHVDEGPPADTLDETAREPTAGAETPPRGIATVPSPLQPTEPRAFDVNAALTHVRALEAFGPRGGGSPAEARAAEYLRSQLAGMGLDARIEEFALPSGSTSRNVVARIEGSSDAVVVLGAHFDTKPPSPGANDNGSGCGALLEIASILSEHPITPTVELVFFGSEETSGGDPNGHHFGSRFRVAQMSVAERANTAGMISIDMIGYGPSFHSRTMGKGPKTLSDMLVAHAGTIGVPITYLRDPGSSGWSDHEAYELAGIPVSWIEWRDDPVYHTAGDVTSHLDPTRVEAAGRLVLDFMRSLDEAKLSALLAR